MDFATLDYSDETPALYIGQSGGFRDAAAPERPQVRRLVSGGGTVAAGQRALRQLSHLRGADGRPHCSATPSTSSARAATRCSTPEMPASRSCSSTRMRSAYEPLDSARHPRHSCRTSVYEVVGFQVRQIVDRRHARTSGASTSCFNPYKSFRYLTEYAGHWNVVSRRCRAAGRRPDAGSSASRSYHGQHVPAFPDRRRDDGFRAGRISVAGARRRDKRPPPTTSSPPRMLSAEVSADKEVTWSLGEYIERRRHLERLGARRASRRRPKGSLRTSRRRIRPIGGRMWRNAALLVGARARCVWLAYLVTAPQKQAFTQDFVYDCDGPAQDASLVTPTFELDGRPSAVRDRTRRRTSTTSGCSSATR